MQEKIDDVTRSPRKKKSQRSLLPLLLLIFGVSGGAFTAYHYLQQKPDEEPLVADKNRAGSQQNDASHQQFSLSSNSPGSETQSAAIGQETVAVLGDPTLQGALTPSQPVDQLDETTPGMMGQSTPTKSLHKEPAESRAAIESFYSYLDQQPDISTFQFGTPSKVYFSQLIQKMLDKPPVVSGETNDLYTILQNTAHFFRVVGPQNILVLKTIISHEKKSYEDILADFYNISRHPEYLRESFAIDLNEDALYDYAGFFLTTMGGRLYLFRRDSSLRMVVSYYSILLVEQAIQSGRNHHGIDIRPVIDNLVGEIENSGNQLQQKEHYLDKLYDLKEKYL